MYGVYKCYSNSPIDARWRIPEAKFEYIVPGYFRIEINVYWRINDIQNFYYVAVKHFLIFHFMAKSTGWGYGNRKLRHQSEIRNVNASNVIEQTLGKTPAASIAMHMKSPIGPIRYKL